MFSNSLLQFSTPGIVTKDILPSLPLTVISYDVVVIDDKPHSVQLYYDNTAEVRMSYTPISTIAVIDTLYMKQRSVHGQDIPGSYKETCM